MGVDLGLRVCRLSVSSGFAGGNIFAGGEMGNSVVVVCRAFAGGELFSPAKCLSVVGVVGVPWVKFCGGKIVGVVGVPWG